MELSKSERKKLRDLTGEIYETEIDRLLGDLHVQFERWQKKEILGSELQREIHAFDQHQFRELWSMYNNVTESMLVARGVALGLIDAAKVPPELLAKLDVGYWQEEK
ncbi:MAG TPA: hypothetical protein VF522_00780 [Ramlibacter sp.]|uniref:hypothetical protein n=1 Tax=Ramlibacter sp. TaxID=1917967 RepID=UPI002ED3CA41